MEKNIDLTNEKLFYDSKSLVQIIQNAVYYGMTEQQETDYKKLTLGMKFKSIVHNSIFVQIFICMIITSILIAILTYQLKLYTLEIPPKKIEEDLIQDINKNNEESTHDNDLYVIKLMDFKMEEFIKKIKNNLF